MHLDLNDEQGDQIVRTLESSGEYLAHSAYNIQFAGQTFSNFPELSGQHGFHRDANSSSGCFSKLWTAASLLLQGWGNNMCEEPKNFTHLFIECPFSRAIWE